MPAVIRIGGAQPTLQLEQQFSTDEQLVYGFDWCCLQSQHQVAATCSFYDERLRLWSLDSKTETSIVQAVE